MYGVARLMRKLDCLKRYHFIHHIRICIRRSVAWEKLTTSESFVFWIFQIFRTSKHATSWRRMCVFIRNLFVTSSKSYLRKQRLERHEHVRKDTLHQSRENEFECDVLIYCTGLCININANSMTYELSVVRLRRNFRKYPPSLLSTQPYSIINCNEFIHRAITFAFSQGTSGIRAKRAKREPSTPFLDIS